MVIEFYVFLTNMYTLLPVELGIGMFAKEVVKRQKERPDNWPTLTIEQINDRYAYCGNCPHFDGVICKEYGCNSNAQAVVRFFTLFLDPRTKCPFLDFGFPAVCMSSL